MTVRNLACSFRDLYRLNRFSSSPRFTIETHMDVVEEKPLAVEKPIAALATRAASLAALPIIGFFCYGAPYVTGLVYRQVYLGRFNVPETLFKSEASDYFVYAYYAVLETLKNWNTFLSSPVVWLSIIGTIGLFALELLALHKLPNTAAVKSIANVLGRNKYVALATGLVSFSTAIATILLLIPVIIFPLILLPAIVGTYGANRAIERTLGLYDKGCDHPTDQKDYCHIIMDGTRIVATGFLVTSSDTRAVIYENNKAKIIPIKDYTIETMPPKEYSALVAAKKIPGIADVNLVQAHP